MPEIHSDVLPPSFCVYTTLTGGYERLHEQPVSAQSRIPFVCLTDDPGLRSETWQMRRVETLFAMDPVRSQRALKLLPYNHLPEFDCSLYIDNTVILSQPPERLIEQFNVASGIALARHTFRDTVLDEFLEVSRLGFDDQNRIFEQLNHYIFQCPELLDEQPLWTGILLRDHRNSKVRTLLEYWCAHVQRYSRRDQLSVNAAFRHTGLKPQILPIDNNNSAFHSWPYFWERKSDKNSMLAAESYRPPVARVRTMELQSQADQRAFAAERAELVARNEAAKRTFEAERTELLSRHEAAERAFAMEKAELLERNAAAARSFASERLELLEAVAHEKSFAALVRTSTSWRITAPMRVAVDYLRGRRRPDMATPSTPVARFHVDPSDERGRALLRQAGDLNPPTRQMWCRLLAERPWTHILDVGANYGEMLLGVPLPEHARILAFEPNPLIAPYLEWNLADAGIRAVVSRSAVSDQVGEAKLAIDRRWSGLTSLGDGRDDARDSMTVPTTTISAILGGAAAVSEMQALIKIDVEGHEARALAGLVELLGGFKDFAALVEVLHVPPQDLDWIIEHFDVELFDPTSNAFVRVTPATRTGFSTALNDARFYRQDVVLRRR